ncbi:hypothetical protein GXW78_16990 [Roseomonas terrae]|uniref:Uncharacterized protein n=1 Tax=Neoroseomonas terrae TaxID=424799 RepID=A0ABS5EL89_9PROT|nr:hypothetical protein [Neoroseomonas terrae]MBR0651372.1 hypothetical protein [Neoroseomonas terrae]
MSTYPRSDADARYTLARLSELLPMAQQALLTLGVDTTIATSIGQEATALRQEIIAVREALPESRSVLG